MTTSVSRCRSKLKRRGFTLIELLVVIAIIAILAAILFPVFAQAKKSAKIAATLSNTKQLGVAINIYSSDYDDVMPMTIQALRPSDPTQPWYSPNQYVGILQTTYPYVKNVDLFWQALDSKPGSLKTPMVPDPVNGALTGTWGDWSKEETILPNNIALNVWDGSAGDIRPRSVTAVDYPAELGIFMPVVGPIQGIATWDNVATDPLVDIDPWWNTCVGSYTDPTVTGGWPPVYAAAFAHGGGLPATFADGHAAKIHNDKFYAVPGDPTCSAGTYTTFYEHANVSKFWGFYLQGYPIVN